MIVKIRPIEEAEAAYFDDVDFHCLDEVIALIQRAGGIELEGKGIAPFHSYQIVKNGSEVYAEIIVGDDE